MKTSNITDRKAAWGKGKLPALQHDFWITSIYVLHSHWRERLSQIYWEKVIKTASLQSPHVDKSSSSDALVMVSLTAIRQRNETVIDIQIHLGRNYMHLDCCITQPFWSCANISDLLLKCWHTMNILNTTTQSTSTFFLKAVKT